MAGVSGVKWAYSTTMPGTPTWHIVGTTFDTMEEAVDAAKKWLMMAAEHNHFIAVRLEKIDQLKTTGD
jgi:hypothetical protein